MGLSAPRAIFGVHSFTPYNRTTGEYNGILKVLNNSTVSIAGEQVKLFGGSNKNAWASEDGPLTSELNIKAKQIENFMIEVFFGKAPTVGSAGATGEVSTIANKKGTSAVSATVGIASVAIASGGGVDLKFAKFVVKVISATTVDVFISTDIDQNRGADLVIQNDALKITASALTIPSTGGTVAIPNTGLEFAGGSGTVAMTADDTATFEVLPLYDSAMNVKIGGVADNFPEFGSIVIAQKRGNEQMFEIDCFRCKAIGLPFGFTENAWAEPEMKADILYDSTEDGIVKIRSIAPT